MSSKEFPSPVVANPMQAALKAFTSGQDIEKAVYGTSSEPAGAEQEQVETEQGEFEKPDLLSMIQDGDQDGTEQESTDQESESDTETQSATSETQKTKATPKRDVEEVLVSSADGTKRKILVDYSDKAKVKKAYEMAAGMRKAFSERDKAQAKLNEMEPKHADLEKSWSALETAFENEGVPGLVNLLLGKKDAYDKFLEQEINRKEYRRGASPEQLKHLEMEETIKQERLERKRLQERVDTDLKHSEEIRAEANQRAMESVVNPAFERYRFAGKLGDSIAEERLDMAVWSQAREQLSSLPDTTEVTRELVDQVFRETASGFRKVISAQVAQKTKQVITKKRVLAQEAAANAASNGMSTGSSAKEKFVHNIRNNDVGSALKDFLSGRIKL